MSRYTVDVWSSGTFPVTDRATDWRRYLIAASDATEAELVACQMAASHAGWTPVRSCVIDWPEGTAPNNTEREHRMFTVRNTEAWVVLTLMVLAVIVLAVAVITGWLPVTIDPAFTPTIGK